MEQLIPIIAAVIAGAGGKALIDWLRFRKVDSATAIESRAKAEVLMHSSDSNILTVNSALLVTWMKAASDANEKIGELLEERALCTCHARRKKERLDLQ